MKGGSTLFTLSKSFGALGSGVDSLLTSSDCLISEVSDLVVVKGGSTLLTLSEANGTLASGLESLGTSDSVDVNGGSALSGSFGFKATASLISHMRELEGGHIWGGI